MTINPAKLAPWPLTGLAGSTGDGSALDGPELDGWVTATAGAERLRLGWQVLPHRSADVVAPTGTRLASRGTGIVRLRNKSTVQAGGVEVYGLVGTSPALPAPVAGGPGTPGSNAAVVDLRAVGLRTDATTLQIAVNSWSRATVPAYPAEFDVYLDTNRDGVPDYVVYNAEIGGYGVTGQTGVFVQKLSGGAGSAFFYSEADFDSANQVLTVPLSAVGLSQGSTFDLGVYAFDNYFSGSLTDSVEGLSWTVGAPAYLTPTSTSVPAGAVVNMDVRRNAAAGPSTQSGLLLLMDDARAEEAALVTVTP